MSTALTSVLQSDGRAPAYVPSVRRWPGVVCPTPLVLAAVAGAIFALVLFALVTMDVPSGFVWVPVLQVAAGSRRLLEKGRDLAMYVAPPARLVL